MIKPPCIDCENRIEACHDYCPKFKGWKRQKQAEEAEINKQIAFEKRAYADKVARKKSFYGKNYWKK